MHFMLNIISYWVNGFFLNSLGVISRQFFKRGGKMLRRIKSCIQRYIRQARIYFFLII